MTASFDDGVIVKARKINPSLHITLLLLSNKHDKNKRISNTHHVHYVTKRETLKFSGTARHSAESTSRRANFMELI